MSSFLLLHLSTHMHTFMRDTHSCTDPLDTHAHVMCRFFRDLHALFERGGREAGREGGREGGTDGRWEGGREGGRKEGGTEAAKWGDKRGLTDVF